MERGFEPRNDSDWLSLTHIKTVKLNFNLKTKRSFGIFHFLRHIETFFFEKMINIDEPLSEGSYEFSPTDRNQFSTGTQIAQTVPGASNFIGKLRNIVDGATNHSPIR